MNKFIKILRSPDYAYSGGQSPEDFVPNSVAELGGMLGKISEQVIREISVKERLAVFNKTLSENGDTIEQVIVKLASPRAYDKNGANALTRKTPDLAVKYFNDWTRDTFDTTVDVPEIRKVLKTGKGASTLSTKIVSVLGESDKQNKYEQIKNLLQWARQDKAGKVLKKVSDIPAVSGSIDYKGVLTAIKDVVSGMQFINTDFNTSSLKRATLADDIYILMPYKLKNKLDVEELAGVFNLDKAELKTKIIEIDTEVETIDAKKSYPVYIVDRNALLIYTRLYEMADQKNADGLFWNYFLHTERMYAISPLFDACYINVKTE